MSFSFSDLWDKTKEYSWDAKNNFDDRMSMEGLLKQARKSLMQYFANTSDSKFIKFEERVSRKILRKARGIAFVTEVKGGFLFGAKGGSGIILCRTDDISGSITVQQTKFRPWSPPCAVGFAGVSAGFIAGLTKIDHIIVLPTQQHIDMFMGAGQLCLKGSADIHLYKYGRNGDAGVGASTQGIAPILSYSFGVKGLFAGISLDGEIMSTRTVCNEMYYDKKGISVKDILSSQTSSNDNGVSHAAYGKAKMLRMNRDYETLIQMLNDYCVDEHLDNNNYIPPSPVTPMVHISSLDDMDMNDSDVDEKQSAKCAKNGYHASKSKKAKKAAHAHDTNNERIVKQNKTRPQHSDELKSHTNRSTTPSMQHDALNDNCTNHAKQYDELECDTLVQ